jgi:small subunit ribosomal protein S13
MARIAGVDLPREKRAEIGLTYIFGIGRATSRRILAEAGMDPETRVHALSDEEVNRCAASSTRASAWRARCAPRWRATSSG